MQRLKATTDHPLRDPWYNDHEMASRVALGPEPGFYVWIWSAGHVGWVYAGDAENAQRLLDLEPERIRRG